MFVQERKCVKSSPYNSFVQPRPRDWEGADERVTDSMKGSPPQTL